jgi:hypothetical protein
MKGVVGLRPNSRPPQWSLAMELPTPSVLNLQKMNDDAEMAMSGAVLGVRLKWTTDGFPKGFDDHNVLGRVDGFQFDAPDLNHHSLLRHRPLVHGFDLCGWVETLICGGRHSNWDRPSFLSLTHLCVPMVQVSSCSALRWYSVIPSWFPPCVLLAQCLAWSQEHYWDCPLTHHSACGLHWFRQSVLHLA